MNQEDKDGQQQSRGLWAAVIFFVALVFLLIVLGGYVQEWEWTGLAVDANRPKRTLWDWLDLLIVPVVLALGGYLFTRSENQRTLQSSKQQREVERAVAKEQAETDREIAHQRRQDDTLQAYLDGMSQLLTDKELPLHEARPGDNLSTVARARTLTVLGRLDSGRKRSILQFLYESGLIYKEDTLLNESDLIERRHNIVSLRQANLSGADLQGANLSEANLIGANLSEANLSGANLFDTTLTRANFRGADLSGAVLIRTLGWTEDQLSEARTLKGATMPDAPILPGDVMPDGRTFEDWERAAWEEWGREQRELRGKDGENE